MGLDVVELVMAVEDEFQIEVADSFGDLHTVGDLHFAICKALGSAEQNHRTRCPSFPPFFAIRDALLNSTANTKRDIRPSKLLIDLIPKQQRRKIWEKLTVDTGIRLPRLQLPNQVFIGLLCVAGCVTFGAVRFFMTRPGGATLSLIVAIGSVVAIFSCWASRPFAVAIPESCQTVGDVVRWARPPVYPSQRSEGMNDTEVIWSKLVTLVSEQLDVPVLDITREARFVEDLKCG